MAAAVALTFAPRASRIMTKLRAGEAGGMGPGDTIVGGAGGGGTDPDELKPMLSACIASNNATGIIACVLAYVVLKQGGGCEPRARHDESRRSSRLRIRTELRLEKRRQI